MDWLKKNPTTAAWYKYRITLSNPIQLKAGKKYWVSIAAKSNTNTQRPSWYWPSTSSQNASGPALYKSETGKYFERPRNRTFAIYSSSLGAIAARFGQRVATLGRRQAYAKGKRRTTTRGSSVAGDFASGTDGEQE